MINSGHGEHDLHDDSDTGSNSSNTERLPTNKKQRLLQSVRLNSPESNTTFTNDTSSAMGGDNNNTIHTKTSNGLHQNYNHLTNPYNQLYNHHQQKKSMDTVLKRLNSKAESDHRNGPKPASNNDTTGSGEMNGSLLDSISSVIEGSESVEAKEQRLSDMINQLQTIKESLVQYKHPKVCSYCMPIVVNCSRD